MSILDQRSLNPTRHKCGGTVLNAADHSYCDRCGAFTLNLYSGAFPDGTDREANDRAWDAGKDHSPYADANLPG